MLDAYLEGVTNIIDHCEIKKDERVLVLAEHVTDRVIADALTQMALEKGAKVSLMYTEPFAIGGSDEPSEIAKRAFFASQLAIVCSGFPILYTKTLWEGLMEHGVRCMEIFGGMANRDTLSGRGPRMSRNVFYAITYYLGGKLFGEKEIKLTSRSGTSFTCLTPPGGLYMGNRGSGRARPLTPGTFHSPPWSSEGIIWPRETGNGVIYFDGFYGTGYSEDPIICTIKDGWCTKIESGGSRSKSDHLKALLSPHKYSMHCTEFAVGVNPSARINLKDEIMIEAQRNCGVVHVALGSRRVGNPPIGHPEFVSRIHLDGTVLYPTVVIGGETLIEDGIPIYLNDPVLRDMVKEWGDPDELLKSERQVVQ